MRKRRKRQKIKIKKKRNWFVLKIFGLFLVWGILLIFTNMFGPEEVGAILVFIVILVFSLVYSFSLILRSMRRIMLFSVGVCVFTYLRLIGLGNILNLLLLGGAIVAIEVYFSRNEGVGNKDKRDTAK